MNEEAKLIYQRRIEVIRNLRLHYLVNLAENGNKPTGFDNTILAAIDELQGVIVTTDLAKMIVPDEDLVKKLPVIINPEIAKDEAKMDALIESIRISEAQRKLEQKA